VLIAGVKEIAAEGDPTARPLHAFFKRRHGGVMVGAGPSKPRVRVPQDRCGARADKELLRS
jgi:hypothetical protein